MVADGRLRSWNADSAFAAIARRRARLQLRASAFALALATLTSPSIARQTGGNGGDVFSLKKPAVDAEFVAGLQHPAKINELQLSPLGNTTGGICSPMELSA